MQDQYSRTQLLLGKEYCSCIDTCSSILHCAVHFTGSAQLLLFYFITFLQSA